MSKFNGSDIILPFCECGCGERVKKPNNRFILGHHTRVIDCAWSRGLKKEDHPGLRKLSEKLKGRTKENHPGIKAQSEKMKENVPWIKGKKHSERSKQKMSNSLKQKNLVPWNKGKTKETSNRMKLISKKISGKNHGQYKGLDSKYANYDLYKDILFCDEIKRNEDNKNCLEVKCSYCGKWYKPTCISVVNRINGLDTDTNKFYCSNHCKDQCPIFRKRRFPKDFKEKARTTEVDPSLRQMVFERDEWECQKCGSKEFLECHHIDPISKEPLFANDMNSCITLCKNCHKIVHTTIAGCNYHELRKCNGN